MANFGQLSTMNVPYGGWRDKLSSVRTATEMNLDGKGGSGITSSSTEYALVSGGNPTITKHAYYVLRARRRCSASLSPQEPSTCVHSPASRSLGLKFKPRHV
eukprot:379984-Prorocentrum_minimum.AAC.3